MNKYYIAHSGTKGMKWGVRRFQNEDGTLTAAGKERYKKQGLDRTRKFLTDEQRRNLRWANENAFRESTERGLIPFYNERTGAINAKAFKYDLDKLWEESGYDSVTEWTQSDSFKDSLPYQAKEYGREMARIEEEWLREKLAKEKQKADSESHMKAHIPASAWNQRMAELNKHSKSK